MRYDGEDADTLDFDPFAPIAVWSWDRVEAAGANGLIFVIENDRATAFKLVANRFGSFPVCAGIAGDGTGPTAQHDVMQEHSVAVLGKPEMEALR